MNCKYCGDYVDVNDKFCSSCGQINPSYKNQSANVFGTAYTSQNNNWGEYDLFNTSGVFSAPAPNKTAQPAQNNIQKNYNDPPKYGFEAYADFWKRYTDFSGCTTRGEFWSCVFINFIIIVLTVVLSALSEEFSFFAISMYALSAFIPSLALVVRRLHDVNKSGSHMLLVFIPFVGWIILLVLMLTPSKLSTYRKG